MPINGEAFQRNIVFYGGPTLVSIKVGSLFTIRKRDVPNYEECLSYFNEKLDKYGLEVVLLKERERSILVYVYSRMKLKRTLESNVIMNYLSNFNYSSDLQHSLEVLKSRMNNKEFPHEIGIFLGYPLRDVLGFLAKEECLYTGYWKVYSNKQNALKTFKKYDQCIQTLTHKLDKGELIEEILEKMY